MNAFGEALNLVFMRGSGDFSSYPPANESQTAFPWVPIPQPMNLRLHSHEFLFPANESQDASPWVPIRGQWNESQTAFPWVPIPCQWISDCIPMIPYSQPNFLESFGWVSPMSCPSYFRNAPRISSVASRTRFWVYPLQSHMGTPKIDCRAF